MATFEQGVYTSVHDLGNRVRAFAIANGWIQDKYVAGTGTTTPTEVYLHKGTNYVSLNFALEPAAFKWYRNDFSSREEPILTLYGNTGFNTGNTVDNQPGSHFNDTSKLTTSHWLLSPCIQYYFFTNVTGDYIHVAIETIQNEFEFFAFGELIKQGAYTGGYYVEGKHWGHSSNWSDWDSSSHHALFDAYSYYGNSRLGHILVNEGLQSWYEIREYDTPYNNGFVVGDTRYRALSAPHLLAISYADRPPLWPIILNYADLNGETTCLGHAPDMRSVSVQNVEPGEIISLGTDEWMIFPNSKKNDPAIDDGSDMNSGWSGIAFKKIL